MAFLEEVWHWTSDFEVSEAQARSSGSLFLSATFSPDENLSATSLSHVCLPDAMLPTMMTDNGLNL